MARPSMAPSRSLTLPEELEKLEQTITLTLQEIDHNFSRAHRIVTSTIIPIVERYAKHSDACWEGTKFWKEFFEASANMSLNHEEAVGEDEEGDTAFDETQTTEDGDPYGTPSTARASKDANGQGADRTPQSKYRDDDLEDSLLDSPSVTVAPNQATPRANQSGSREQANPATYADYPSPYETLKQEMQGKAAGTKNAAPSTPGKPIDLSATTPQPPSAFATSSQRLAQNPDPILHRMLDKTYRVHATPHTARKKAVAAAGPSSGRNGSSRTHTLPNFDSSPFSPQLPAPQLRAEIFGSPQRAGPRTPGVSIQKPRAFSARRQGATDTGRGRDPFGEPQQIDDVWESSEVEDDMGISPPKTMQFVVPQSRLLQTPAREASKRIVENLLLTAGGDITDDTDEIKYDEDIDLDLGDDSPSVVRKMGDPGVDDSF